jgi:PhnB protein
MAIKLNPYIIFNDGQSAQAIALYEKALGAKVDTLMRYGDAAAMGQKTPPELKDHVMHSELRIGDGVIMVMDASPERRVPVGANVQVTLHFDDAAELDRRFDALAAGGTVKVPPHDEFWGDRFGTLVDAFGMSWMFLGHPKKS